MSQRRTLIVRMQWNPAAQEWQGQVEMVNPHRQAIFRQRKDLWALLEEWSAPPTIEARPGDETQPSRRTTSKP